MIAALLLALQSPETAGQSRIPYRPPPPACTHRPTPAGTELMVVGLYRGETLSSAWVGNPDQETAVVPFRVAPGSQVHLVISGYGQNVYRFSGATGRIRRLTVMGHASSAVAGLPRARVEFAAACLTYGLYGAGSQGEAAVRRYFGRSPASLLSEYSPFRIRIGSELRLDPPPSPPPSGDDPETNELNRFTPSGVAEVDPRDLVASAPTGRYVTLPQEAGIRQLVRAGALVRATEADARAWRERALRRGVADPRAPFGSAYGIYRVTRPITVPSGLCGAHSVSFYVPSPDHVRGDPCHSTLYFDDGSAAGPDAPR